MTSAARCRDLALSAGWSPFAWTRSKYVPVARTGSLPVTVPANVSSQRASLEGICLTVRCDVTVTAFARGVLIHARARLRHPNEPKDRKQQ